MCKATLTQLLRCTMNTTKVALPGLTNKPQMAQAQFPEGKNPFEAVSQWTPDLLSKVEVLVSTPVETTSDFTRTKKPGARYWSSDVTFKYKNFESKVIKMSSCDIPYIASESYGGDYMYALINRAIGDAVVRAGTEATLTVQANDDKLACSGDIWWKTINKIKGRVGTLNKEGSFVPRDFHGILAKTEGGVRGTIDVIFKLKCHTDDKSNRTGRTPFKIVADCSRFYIKQLNQDIVAPPLEATVETIRGNRADVATDDLMSAIDALELS